MSNARLCSLLLSLLLSVFAQPGIARETLTEPGELEAYGTRATESVFEVVEAPNGMLNTTLLGDAVNVEVLHQDMAVGESLQVNWSGRVDRVTPPEPVIDRGTPVSFALPKAWALENRGRSVTVSYTVTAADGSSRPASEPLVLQVTSASLENGRAVFYLSTQARVTGQAGARFIQQDFFDTTGRVLPVVRVSLSEGQASAFSFYPEDQAVAL